MAAYVNYVSTAPDAEFPAEAGRYHLYVTLSCPYACRALAALYMKGLDSVVGVSVAHPIFQKTKPEDPTDDHKGWTFVDPATEKIFLGATGDEYPTTGCSPDPVHNAKFVRDLYELVDKEPRRYTVPLLWDKKKDTIVCNESADLLRMFNSGFGDLVPSSNGVDLLPGELESEIEAMNAGLVESVGSGVFKVVMAKEEEARLQALADYFANIQQAEDLLAKSRYLVSNGITEADIRLFHSLIRFDLNQRAEDKLNLNQYPNLVNYLRDLYQTPALKKTVKWEHLKLMLVNFGLGAVTTGPFVDYDAPHDRATRFLTRGGS
ncbi:Glutathione s-transferase [Globisporangium polare]